MRAGDLRQRVDIQSAVTETDSTGQDTYSFKTVASKVPAQVRNITQRKSEDGFIQNSGHETYEVWMRYTDLISYNSRLLFEGLTMSVTAIEQHRELRHSMKLKCEVVDQ